MENYTEDVTREMQEIARLLGLEYNPYHQRVMLQNVIQYLREQHRDETSQIQNIKPGPSITVISSETQDV